MRAPLPRFLVLGGPIPDLLRVELSGAATLAEVANLREPVADGILAHARSELTVTIQMYRDQGGKLPIFVLADPPVRIEDRIRWIRDGADDVLDLNTASSALVNKMRSEAWRSNATITSSNAAPPGVRVDSWLQASSRYLAIREQLIAAMGEGARARYLDCVFLRDQLMRASDGEPAPDVFGQRRGSDRESLGWPFRMTRPLASSGELLNIGADGACLSMPIAPGPGEQLTIDVAGDRVAGRVDLEVRWQRRVARGRWQVGAFALGCTLDIKD